MRRRAPIITRSRCIIAGEGGVLLQKDEDGIYGIPGGRLEFDETLPLCAVRELREEAGIEVTPQRLVYVVEYLGVKKGRYRHEILFFFLCDHRGELRPKSKALTFEWRDPKEVSDRFWPEPLAEVISEDYPSFDKVRFIVIVNGRLIYLNTFLSNIR